MQNKWYHIQYEDGSNPYIAKSYKEIRKLKRKYKDKMVKVKRGFYFIKRADLHYF